MSKRVFSGYQVRSKDLNGISLTNYDFETCKRYCRKGDVIVSTYPLLDNQMVEALLETSEWSNIDE